MLRPLVAAALAAGALLATPANAGTRCFGSHELYYVCVVYSPVDPGSPLPMEDVEVYCGGQLCGSTDAAAGT